MRVFILVFFSAFIGPLSYGQESRYQTADLAEITQQWNSITKDYAPGLSILGKPQFVSLKLRAAKQPYSCNPGVLKMIGRIMRLKIPVMPEYHCADFISETGMPLKMHLNPNVLEKINAVSIGTDLVLSAQIFAYVVEADRNLNRPFAYLDDVSVK